MNLTKSIRNLLIGLIFIVPAFAFIVAGSYFFPFITGKAFYFRILTEVIFAGWVILAFLDARYRPRLTRLTLTLTLFTAITLIADLLGVNPIRSLWSNFERMEGWITIVHLWAFYIATTSLFGPELEGRRWWHRWFNMSLLAAFGVALYSFSQLFGWSVIHQGGARIDASLGNAEYLAVYMLFHAFIAAYMFFTRQRTEPLKWLYGALFLIYAFLVAETQTRGAILGMIIGFTLFCISYALFATGFTWKKVAVGFSFAIIEAVALFTLPVIWMFIIALVYLAALIYYAYATRTEPGMKEIQKGRYISVGIVAIMVLVVTGFYLARNSSFVKNDPTLKRLSEISINDTTTQARGYIWPMAVRATLQRPLFGWGQENFNYIFNAYYTPKMYTQEQWFDRAHSVPLDWMVASGFTGLVAYLALYILFVLAVWRIGNKLTLAEKSMLTGLIAAYFIHTIFVFDNLASYVMFAAVLGFASTLEGSTKIAWFGSRPIRRDAVEYIVAPIAVIALVFCIYFYNARPMTANTDLIQALIACNSNQANPDLFSKALSVNTYVANQEIREQIMQCTGTVIGQPYASQIKQAFAGLAGEAVQQQVAATPKDARAYMLGGTTMNGLNQFDIAAALLETAHRLSPGKQTISFEYATSLVNTGQAYQALALLDQTYHSETSNPQAQTAYALALILNKKSGVAEQLFADKPDLFKSPRIALAYAKAQEYDKAIKIFNTILAANPADLDAGVGLAQTQFAAGNKQAAIETMRTIVEKNHPEYKDQIEASIKALQ